MGTEDKSWQALLQNRFYIGEEIPTSGAELAKRLTESLQMLSAAQSLPGDGVQATITSPPNVELLQLNLSGFAVADDPNSLQKAKAQVSSDVSGVADRVPAQIAKMMVKAHPLIVREVPAEFDLQAEGIPFNWVIDKQGKVWFGLASESPQDMHGEFAARITKADLQRAAFQAASVGAAKNGLKLQDLDLEIRQVGNDFSIVGSAKLKKGFLSARADAKAAVKYDPKTMVATVADVQVASGNPAVAMILRMADSQIAKFRGQTFDLNQLLGGTGLQLTSLEVTASAADVRLVGKF